MKNINRKKKDIELFDNANIVTNLLLLMIVLIVILSQSFAIKNRLGVVDILSGILNHNIGYLLVFIYFIALKTRFGKKYFDFFNVFLILLYFLITIASLLTVFQSFGLGSLLDFTINLLVFLYMFHTFLRSTIIWKSMHLDKSPFNEISNSNYFYSILVLSVTLLSVNLIFTTSLHGTILALMDFIYIILFVRYIFLYGDYLNNKKNKDKLVQFVNEVKFKVDGFDEGINNIKESFVDIVDDVNEITKGIEEKIAEIKDDEIIKKNKEEVSKVVNNVQNSVKTTFSRSESKNKSKFFRGRKKNIDEKDNETDSLKGSN